MTSLLLGLGLAATALQAAPAPGPDEAQALYDAADYERSAQAWRELARREPNEAAWHYDLGNALYKSGRLGPAVASFQRAFDLSPRDEAVRHNLAFALRRTGEELVPEGVPHALWRAFRLLSLRELAGLHWLAWWALLLLAGAWLSWPRRREALGPWTASALAAWLVLGGWWAARRSAEPAARGVIVKAGAEVRSGPGERSSVSFTSPEGRRVQILTDGGAWLEIGVIKEGAKGWIESSAVERL